MKDKFLNDGDPIKFEDRECVFLTCCECGLTHLLMFGSVDGEKVLYVYRDDNLTEESRKEVKVKEEKKKSDKEIIEENKEELSKLDVAVEEEKEEMEAQEVIDKADEVIKKAENVMGELRKCSKCGVNEILSRNKTGICTPCQLEPKKKK